jgi:hypothetical protein
VLEAILGNRNIVDGNTIDLNQLVIVLTMAEMAGLEDPVGSGLYPSLTGVTVIVSDEGIGGEDLAGLISSDPGNLITLGTDNKLFAAAVEVRAQSVALEVCKIPRLLIPLVEGMAPAGS